MKRKTMRVSSTANRRTDSKRRSTPGKHRTGARLDRRPPKIARGVDSLRYAIERAENFTNGVTAMSATVIVVVTLGAILYTVATNKGSVSAATEAAEAVLSAIFFAVIIMELVATLPLSSEHNANTNRVQAVLSVAIMAVTREILITIIQITDVGSARTVSPKLSELVPYAVVILGLAAALALVRQVNSTRRPQAQATENSRSSAAGEAPASTPAGPVTARHVAEAGPLVVINCGVPPATATREPTFTISPNPPFGTAVRSASTFGDRADGVREKAYAVSHGRDFTFKAGACCPRGTLVSTRQRQARR
jgi:uncharacterized membrane protein (DUF373 family)